MTLSNIRENKLALKSLLMKNVKVDDKERVFMCKDDEWIKETEWDELYNDITK